MGVSVYNDHTNEGSNMTNTPLQPTSHAQFSSALADSLVALRASWDMERVVEAAEIALVISEPRKDDQ